jgi:hypothetical protein
MEKFGFAKSGIVKTIALAGVVILLVFYALSFFKSDAMDDASTSTYVCSETGKPFKHANKVGETIPILSPFSGKNTGYPAEACFWTADGSTKKDPTWVLLNSVVGKTGPTFCPDCGRLVVGHNPAPKPGGTAPPTRAEWFAQHQALSY